MALYCFWCRRTCSRYAALGISAPPGSKLDAHLAACGSCRAYLSDLSMLATDLDSLIVVPQPSAQYAEPVWDRIKPTSRSHRWGPISLTAAAACGLACGLTFWFASKPHRAGPSEPTWVVKVPAPSEEQARTLPTLPGQEPDAGGRIGGQNADGPGERIPIAWRSAHHRRHRTRAFAPDRPETGPVLVSASDRSATWRTSGILYESQGDPGLANAAYQAAYSANPSQETAFDMGRSAEESGDMEQAMDVYARLLDGADAAGQSNDTEKGWTP